MKQIGIELITNFSNQPMIEYFDYGKSATNEMYVFMIIDDGFSILWPLKTKTQNGKAKNGIWEGKI